MSGKRLLEKEVKLIIKRYTEGSSIRKCGDGICSHFTVAEVLKKNGIAIRPFHRMVKANHETFMSMLTKNDLTECLEWTGGVNNKGYGQFCINSKKYFTHRYSYEYFKGSVGSLHVLHKCDNPKCCNPDHLFLGTHKQNMEDCKRKGRNYVSRKVNV